ncbi:hypothetical protein [Tellurirhabdus rosea]|uniref:hypothetical protein n=1 Tax=Tellurirhabdus rosea TaxID=2674997 RepID=UPI00225922F6|nr:hypothetical protein [Tellurirhabdus rosea]
MKTSAFLTLLTGATLALGTAQAQVQTALLASNHAARQMPVLKTQEILDKHIQALGGTEKLNALKTVIVRQTTSAQGQDIPQTLYIVQGKAVRSEMNAMGIEIIVAAREDSGWQVNPAAYGNKQPVAMEPKQAKAACAQADVFGAIISAQAKGHTIAYDGDEKIDGDLCYRLAITNPRAGTYTAFVSQKSNMVVKLVTKSTEAYYSDYRNVDGYQFPHTVEVIASGTKVSLIDRRFEVNKPIDDALFAMPVAN